MIAQSAILEVKMLEAIGGKERKRYIGIILRSYLKYWQHAVSPQQQLIKWYAYLWILQHDYELNFENHFKI